jgi:hypothetical protein
LFAWLSVLSLPAATQTLTPLAIALLTALVSAARLLFDHEQLTAIAPFWTA